MRKQQSEVFRRVLDEAVEKLKISSDSAGSFEHRGIKGDERAAELAAFLEQHLPSEFEVRKGEAIDCTDARTGQLDLVIFDGSCSAPILVGRENVLLPCE